MKFGGLPMDTALYNDCVSILKEELLPAMCA